MSLHLFFKKNSCHCMFASLIESGCTNVKHGNKFVSVKNVSLVSSRHGTSTWRWSGNSPVGVSPFCECVFTEVSFSTTVVGQLPQEQLSLSRRTWLFIPASFQTQDRFISKCNPLQFTSTLPQVLIVMCLTGLLSNVMWFLELGLPCPSAEDACVNS